MDKAKDYKRGKLPAPDLAEKDLLYAEAYAVKCVDRDMDVFSFNTAIARLMEFLTAIYKYDGLANRREEYTVKAIDTFLMLLAPCAPHFSEELWSIMGNKKSVFLSDYPICDESALERSEVELAVQVNSKMKAKIVVPSDADDETIKAAALAEDAVKKTVDGKQIVKAIIVKGRLVNLIVK